MKEKVFDFVDAYFENVQDGWKILNDIAFWIFTVPMLLVVMLVALPVALIGWIRGLRVLSGERENG